MTTYHRGVVTAGEGIVIILLCVTTSTSNIYLNNVTKTIWRVNRKGTPTRRQPVRCLCTPHRRTLFGEGRRGTTKALLYTFPSSVGSQLGSADSPE